MSKILATSSVYVYTDSVCVDHILSAKKLRIEYRDGGGRGLLYTVYIYV